MFRKRKIPEPQVLKTLADLEEEVAELKTERDRLQENIRREKLEHKIVTEDIKHMTRLKEERLEVETDKIRQKLEREKDQEISKIKQEYFDKVERMKTEEIKRLHTMYEQVLARLPDIGVALEGKVGN